MKKNIIPLFFFSLVFSIISCEDTDLKCSSHIAQSTVIKIYQDYTLQSVQIKRGQIDESFVLKFLNQNMSFDMVRTTGKDEKLNICECEAKINFDLPEEFKRAQLSEGNIWYKNMNNEEREFLGMIPIKEELNNGIDIMYNLQKIDNGDIMAETYEIEVLPQIIYAYSEYLKEKKQNEDTQLNVEEVSENSNVYTSENDNSELYETSKSEKEYGKINGTNVIIRSSYTTKSDKVRLIKNKGEEVEILEKKNVSDNSQAILKTDVNIEIDNVFYVIPNRKAVQIKSRNEKSAQVTFQDESSNTLNAEIDLKWLEFMKEDWYKVKTSEGQIGWVYGKFIITD